METFQEITRKTPQVKVEKTSHTWADYYRDRVGNRDYLDSFELQYGRFIDEIILQIKRLFSESEKPIILKEEGCGIGSIVRCISRRESQLIKSLGIEDREHRDEVDKVVLSDVDKEMLTLCMSNTRNLYMGEYLGGKPFYYSKESIQEQKFFEPNTVVVTHGVLEHFPDGDIKKILATYNDENVSFQAHYVPTNGYESPSFGDERLLPVQDWISMVQPDYYIVDNGGLDLYMFKLKSKQI